MDIQTESQSIPIEFRHKKLQAPESLFTLCLKYVTSNLDTICSQTPEGYTLHEGLTLPNEICEPFIETYQDNGGEIFDCIAHLFKDVTKTNLRSVNIRYSSITDDGLEYLLRHNLYKISLSHCQNLTSKTFVNIFKYAINLQSLTIGPNIKIPTYKKLRNFSVNEIPIRIKEKVPNLRHLVLRIILGSPYSSDHTILDFMVNKISQLKVLDLSYCLGVGSLQYLWKFTSLHTLILFDVRYLQEISVIRNICTLKSLVVLDISQTDSFLDQGIYEDENKTLAFIVNCLPNLMYLDISGTNLAGTGIIDIPEYSVSESLNNKKSDIPGLQCRIDNPLEFLGLYHTMHNACERQNIPAKIISGDANEEQLFNAAASCICKPQLLKYILEDLHHLLKNDKCTQIDRALEIALEALTRYVKEKTIQISGSAMLFYIVKIEDWPLLLNNNAVRKRIVITILNGMNYHKYDGTVLRNGCLTLLHLKLPQDVMFAFKLLVQMLLHIISTSDRNGFIQRTSIFLLKLVVCNINKQQQLDLGDAGVIEKIMAVIKYRFRRRMCDDIFEFAWFIMWNIMKGAPINCERFLDENGMKFILRCIIAFSNKDEVMHNMMGLMGCVAEVKELRPKLMHGYFIKIFARLLYSTQNRMEVSYTAAGVIAHLASDGYGSWTISTPSRYKVLAHMSRAMQNWDLNADRNINYYSFKSILKLAQVKHTPHCAHWVTWTLANLTKVYPEKYCSIVIAEDGLKIMNELLEEFGEGNQNSQHGVIYDLAQTVINQCQMYMKNTVESSSK